MFGIFRRKTVEPAAPPQANRFADKIEAAATIDELAIIAGEIDDASPSVDGLSGRLLIALMAVQWERITGRRPGAPIAAMND